ncbi:MAG: TolC family protein [Cyanobacteria bacterium SZAS LIN-3]|nr:TolC family protein [Cyanobacteria bacterium SZAS LIN-3]
MLVLPLVLGWTGDFACAQGESKNGTRPALPYPLSPLSEPLPPSTPTTSPLSRPLSPSTGLNDRSTMPVTPEAMPRLRGLGPDDKEARARLEDIAEEATKSSGSIFVDQDNVFVKPPMLSALITLNKNLSPLQLDAYKDSSISLRDVLTSALTNNLPIKISAATSQVSRYQYYNALTSFLPSITNGVAMQGLRGNYVSPAGLYIPIRNPYFTSLNSFTQPLFEGGAILFTARQQKHTFSASRYAFKGTVNDILQDSASHYYNLVREDVLLQIRVKAVEVSKALVQVNQDLFDNGVNTELDVLQAKYQLSADRQKLIKQQISRREAAVRLATVLNQDQGIDLEIKDRLVSKKRLVDASLKPNDLLKIAIDKRPELKKYEELRLAAKDAVKVARAAFFPQITMNGSIIGTGSHATSISNQTSNTTPVGSNGSLAIGSITGASGLPIASGNSSGARFTTRSLYSIGVDVNWSLGGLGTTQLTNLEASRWQARKVQLEFNTELNRICEQVRDAYLNSLAAENLIIETTDAVKYATEGLRLADVRFQEGVGTYLDVINAQHTYTDALIDKANAIIDFNSSQTKLLHAIGCLTVDTCTAAQPLKHEI